MRAMISVTCVYFILIVSFISADEGPLVKINDGLIRGVFLNSTNGRTFASFEGIPFAEPPVEKRRFKEPFPVKPWSGVLIANTRYTCIQYFDEVVRGQEDCLYLNVYVPRRKINPEERLDVIVHIHGGGFMVGSATAHIGAEQLMDRDIVFVSFNYRLGPFGFLSSHDADITGNFGMKDQSFVLKWIQDNIAVFGGNSDSVTITGLYAGGASVHLHYFSPMSKGLFHKGFAQSGSALVPWSIQKNPFENYEKLSNLVGCFNESVRITLQCLRQRSALQLTEVIKHFVVNTLMPLAPFSPVTEFISHSTFMMIPPYYQLGTNITNDLPIIFSTTTEDGLLSSGFFYQHLDKLNEDWETIFPLMLKYDHIPGEEKQRINKILKKNYFKDEPITMANLKSLIKLCTHRNFVVGSVKAAKMQSKISSSPIYYLRMSFGGDNINKLFTETNVYRGILHGADAMFYYDIPMISPELSSDELEMKDKLLDMLVNFAKTGNVVLGDINWKPVSDSEIFDSVLMKGPHDITAQTSMKFAPISFWTSLGLREDENIYTFTKSHVRIDK